MAEQELSSAEQLRAEFHTQTAMISWQDLQPGKCALQALPCGAFRPVQAQRYNFSTCNQHAIEVMP